MGPIDDVVWPAGEGFGAAVQLEGVLALDVYLVAGGFPLLFLLVAYW